MTVTERLLHYVSFDTQSDESSETCPSTAKQKLLGEALVEEMRALGIADARIDADGYVYGSVPGTPGAPAIGLIAHMDTSPDCSGKGIKPRIVEYTGGDIALNDTTALSPEDFPILNRSVGKHLIVTDKDLFTARNISIEDIRILDGAFPDKVISYTGSVIVASGSCLATAFTDLMQRNNCTLMPVESFTCNESGGLSALVNGEEVLVGSSAFMNLKGVHLPQQLSAKNVVFTSINGLFVASFKIKYVPVQSVQNALFALLRTKIAPIFAVRDFNITPLMLGQKFKMSTDGFDFPAYRKRYAMSAAEPSDYTQTAGIVARDGLGPLVSVANLGRQLYSTVRICVILALLCTVIGVVLMFALCAIGAFDSATVGNLFVYMGLWLVPVILLNFSLKR